MSLSDVHFNKLIAGYPPLINIGCGEDMTISELAETVAKVVGFDGMLRFDTFKPDGTLRKLLDVSQLFALGWRPKVSLEQGLALVYKEFSSYAHAAFA